MNHYFKPLGLNWGKFCPLLPLAGDLGHCPETLLVVLITGEGATGILRGEARGAAEILQCPGQPPHHQEFI